MQPQQQRQSFVDCKRVFEGLTKLEYSGVIKHIDASEWIVPVMVAQKRNGDIQLWVDLHKPNIAVVLNSHPLPYPNEFFHQLSGGHIFSKLDLTFTFLFSLYTTFKQLFLLIISLYPLLLLCAPRKGLQFLFSVPSTLRSVVRDTVKPRYIEHHKNWNLVQYKGQLNIQKSRQIRPQNLPQINNIAPQCPKNYSEKLK